MSRIYIYIEDLHRGLVYDIFMDITIFISMINIFIFIYEDMIYLWIDGAINQLTTRRPLSSMIARYIMCPQNPHSCITIVLDTSERPNSSFRIRVTICLWFFIEFVY